MAKYELKTKVTDVNLTEFLNKVEPDQKRLNAFEILDSMKKVTGQEPKMWGSSIIGFGQYHCKYESGQEGDFMAAGFSPRKAKRSLYIMGGIENYPKLTPKLGKFKNRKPCLYIQKLADIDKSVVEKLVREPYDYITNKTWPKAVTKVQ
tara:strand:+ start:3471 stop:3917 length:447 start_codon:yes stop_codon:yes gene_type:complete